MAAQSPDHAKSANYRRTAPIEADEDILLGRGGPPAARVMSVSPSLVQRQFGAMRDVLSIGPAFFEPLPDIAMWE